MSRPAGSVMARALVRLVAWIVPAAQRQRWLEEWRAEIWHYAGDREHTGWPATRAFGLLARCLGAVPHAFSLRGEGWRMERLVNEVRLVVRTFARRPLFTAVAVLTLGIGIGGTAGMYSVVESVLLAPLPIPDADRLVWLWGTTSDDQPTGRVSPPDFRDYREAETGLELAAYDLRSATLVEGGRPQALDAARVTSSMVSVLGRDLQLGRAFTRDEEAPGAHSVLISHAFWQDRFSGRPDALGSTLVLDGAAHVIVGVLPADLGFLDTQDVWLPLPVENPGWSSRSTHFLRTIGRLREGRSLEGAQAALDAVSRRLEATYPDTNQGWYALAVPLRDVFVSGARPVLLLLMGAVVLLLLIAATNVAGLLVARSSARRGEMAVRTALGATRSRIVQQLLGESVILALAGGLVGVAFARGIVATVARLRPAGLPRASEIGMSGGALLLALSVSLAVGLLFGLAPAARLTRATGTSTPRGDAPRTRFGAHLVSAQVALSTMLLVGAILLIRSLGALLATDPGLDPKGVVVAPVAFTAERFATTAEVIVAAEETIDRIAAIPGVTAAAATNIVPFTGQATDTYVHAAGAPPENPMDPAHTAQIRTVTDDYFRALGITITKGRTFNAGDVTSDGPEVTVVNETLARRLWPDADPLGRELVLPLSSERARVVGVAKGVRQFDLGAPPPATFYVLHRQEAWRGMNLVIRAEDPGRLLPALREAVWETLPEQPLDAVLALEDLVAGTTAGPRFQAGLVSVFAGIAMLLASVGIYGALAHWVGERRRDIGIRLAVGASRAGTVAMVVGMGGRLTLVGLVAGLLGSAATGRFLSAVLYGIEPLDPASYAAAPLLLAVVALTASYVPAVRAAGIDPAATLNQDSP